VSASANECIVGIVRAGEAFVALANRALSGYQLSPAARQALAVLDGAGEPLSPTEIARRLIVTTASVTSLLDTLERRGLVERRPDPADRRRLLVAITPPAQAMVRQYVPEVVALQGAVMSGQPVTARTKEGNPCQLTKHRRPSRWSSSWPGSRSPRRCTRPPCSASPIT
jgi:DNA-binding MarR family transcriptional regulator